MNFRNISIIGLICSIFLLTCLIAPVFAGTVTNATTGYSTPDIRSALNDASAGDVLWAEGLFNECNITWPNKDNMTLMVSPTASSPATIDAQFAGKAITLEAAVTLTIEGITIKRGYANDSQGGSAICLISGSNLTLNNSVIENCSCEGSANGAVYSNGSVVTARGSIFRNNSAVMNGAVASGGTWYAYDCTFRNNSARSGGVSNNVTWTSVRCGYYGNVAWGGNAGVANSGDWTASRSTFEGNSASNTSGVFFAQNSLSITDCVFSNNASGGMGGVFGATQNLSAVNCVFRNNSAGSSSGVMVGINMTAVNCVFSGNNSNSSGGVIVATNFNAENCTFYSNVASSDSGVGRIYGDLTCSNSIFKANYSPSYPVFQTGATTNVNYSDIQSNGFIAGTGNISLEPMFVSTAEPCNLRLSNTSPCIDTGTSAGAPSFDIDGNTRPFYAGYDMGAYEYVGSDGPTIEASYFNNVRFAPGDIISISGTIKLILNNVYGVASADLYMDNSSVPIPMVLSQGSTFEGSWTCAYSISPQYVDVNSHIFLFRLIDGKGNRRDVPMTAAIIAGRVQVIGTPLNYPNPFRPLSSDPSMNTTTIQYVLSTDAPITVIIYDITGHEVKRINSSAATNGGRAGTNSVQWNGTSLFGEVSGNGMYVYKIISGRTVIGSGKVVIFD